MGVSLKPLDQQVIVITGASSGIGLATVMAAAEKGARLVLTARSERTLEDVVQQIQDAGGEAIAVAADIGKREQVERAPPSRGSGGSTPGSTTRAFRFTDAWTR